MSECSDEIHWQPSIRRITMLKQRMRPCCPLPTILIPFRSSRKFWSSSSSLLPLLLWSPCSSPWQWFTSIVAVHHGFINSFPSSISIRLIWSAIPMKLWHRPDPLFLRKLLLSSDCKWNFQGRLTRLKFYSWNNRLSVSTSYSSHLLNRTHHAHSPWHSHIDS